MINDSILQFGCPPIVLTYNDILKQYGNALINTMLIADVMFLILSFCVVQYTMSLDLRTWGEMVKIEKPNKEDREEMMAKFFRVFGWICLPISLFFALMLIAYKLGVVL